MSIGPKRPIQKPFSVTLSGTSLAAVAIGLAILSHQHTIQLARLAVVLMPLVLFVYNDYQNFLRLGPGGIPSTPRGYLKVSWFKIWANKSPFEPPPAEPHYTSTIGVLRKVSLPKRQDERPATAGIAPHRQITQHGSTQCFEVLSQTLKKFAAANPSDFETKTSCLEKYGLALFSKHTVVKPRAQGEICHVHDSDHSLHLFLHPDDIKEVLDKGWGERHPMAWEWGLWKPVVGPFFVMIYAPRNENELRVVAKIIEAAAWNLSGKEIQLDAYISSM
ncbi:hypothetical protein CC79DRAFT_1364706 [Sarocladium strictum]